MTQTFEENNWLEAAAPLQDFPSITSDRIVDWLVIGAGFSGLAAARHLAQQNPDDEILLLDAGKIGTGSSSRSSGFVVSIGDYERPGAEENERLYQLGNLGLRRLHRLVHQNDIKCNWDDSGRLIGARHVSGMNSLRRTQKCLEALGSPIEVLESAEVQQITGMTGYLGAIRQCDSAMVNPALLLRGLVECLPSNVQVFENSKVTKISHRSAAIAHCGELEISARRILVTSNPFALNLGLGCNRVFPMRTFVSAATLPPQHASRHQPDWGITSPERIGSSVRSFGNKVLIRGGAYYGFKANDSERELAEVSSMHLAGLRRRFPDFNLEIENTWSGVIGITANGAQYFGHVKPCIFCASGFNGHGMAQGTVTGEALADLAMQRQTELQSSVESLRKPNWIPSGSILHAGVKAYVNWLSWRYREEI